MSAEKDFIVTVKGARRLKITQTIGEQDPYLRIWSSSIRDKKFKTKTYVDGGSLAVWNETFEIHSDNPVNDFIFIEVKNENNLTSDVTIGRLKLPCSELPRQPVEGWYKIFDDGGDFAGEVHMIVSTKSLQVETRKARSPTRVSISNTNSPSNNNSDSTKVNSPVVTKSYSQELPPPPAVTKSSSTPGKEVPPLPQQNPAVVSQKSFEPPDYSSVHHNRNSSNRNSLSKNSTSSLLSSVTDITQTIRYDDLPDIGSVSVTPPHSTNSSEAKLYQLPPGWEEIKTPEGKAYYSYLNHQVVTWMRPV